MKEICIPAPNFSENQIADVVLTVNNMKVSYSYRVESFPCNLENAPTPDPQSDHDNASIEQIEILRNSLSTYDKSWEFIQIFTTRKGATHIQVLYRKRNNQ